MGGFSRLKRQPSLHGLSSRMSPFMSQDLDLPWTLSTKDNNNSLQYPTKSSAMLGKSNKSKGTGRLFNRNKKISIITRGVSPTITVISETSSSSSSSSEEEEGFEIDVNILSSDDTVYNNLDNSDYNNTYNSNSSARSGELSSAHSGSLTTFANNCSPPILIPTNFDIEMDIIKSNNGGDGIIESLSSLDKSSSNSKRSSSPKSVRSRLTVTPIVEFCTDNNETVLGSVSSPISDNQINESEVVNVGIKTNDKENNSMKEKMCHILVDELGSSIETLRSGGSVLSTNTSASSSSGSDEQPKMFILPEELTNVGSSIETLRSGSAISEKIFILPQEKEGSRLSLDHQEEEKSRVSSSSGRSTPQEEQGLQLDIDKLQAYETIMKHLTAYEEMSKLSGVQATSSPLVEVQKSKSQGEKKRSLLDRVGNHLDKKTYQGIMKRSRRRRSRRLRKKY